MKLEDDHYCFACGTENPEGLHLSFEKGGRGVLALFTAEKRHQGYRDMVHGGIISTILDEAMAHAAIKAGHYPVTAEISVRFTSALMIGQKVQVEAWIEGDPPAGHDEKRKRRLFDAASELRTWPDGGLVASAKAKLIQP